MHYTLSGKSRQLSIFNPGRNSLHAQQAKAHNEKQRPVLLEQDAAYYYTLCTFTVRSKCWWIPNYLEAIAACAAARRAIGTRNGEQDT